MLGPGDGARESLLATHAETGGALGGDAAVALADAAEGARGGADAAVALAALGGGGPVAALAALGVAATAYFAPALAKPRAVRALARRAEARRALVLTFDDGPGPRVTEALADLLAEHGARATFFVNGARAVEHAAVVARLARAGHELGSHGFAHVHAWRAAPWRAYADVARGAWELARLAPEARLFRPPYGKATAATQLAALRHGLRLAWWTHDSGDSHAELPERLPGRRELLERGGVVLLHDLDRSAPRNEYVLRVTRELLESASGAGLEVLTLGQLLAV